MHTQVLSPERWKELFVKNVGSTWRKRKELYEQNKALFDLPENVDEPDLTVIPIKKRIDVNKTTTEYNEIANNSSGTILLPSVPPESKKKPYDFVAAVLTTMEQQTQIEQAQKERDRALTETKCYRDMAEKLKKEKRELESKLRKETEVVRDFWRSKILEGSTRSGRILRASLSHNK